LGDHPQISQIRADSLSGSIRRLRRFTQILPWGISRRFRGFTQIRFLGSAADCADSRRFSSCDQLQIARLHANCIGGGRAGRSELAGHFRLGFGFVVARVRFVLTAVTPLVVARFGAAGFAGAEAPRWRDARRFSTTASRTSSPTHV
jgi:hypothetical protein